MSPITVLSIYLIITQIPVECNETVASGCDKLFKEYNLHLLLDNKFKNVLISPLLVHSMLTFIYLGATGVAAERLKTQLGVSSPNETVREYERLIRDITRLDRFNIKMHNRIYVDKGIEVSHDFVKRMKRLRGYVEKIDFADKNVSSRIVNSWVRKTTKNRMNVSADDTLEHAEDMMLVSSLYFKGKWKYKFNKRLVRKEIFHLENGSRIDVDMMYIRNKFRVGYKPELMATLVEIPYKENNLCMLIFLPDRKTSLRNLELNLNSFDYSNYGDYVLTGSYRLGVPKFVIEDQTNMRTFLEKINLGILFEHANLSNINSRLERVGRMIQTTVFEVNEDGNEVLNIMFEKTLLKYVNEPIVLNYPFLFAVIYASQQESHLLFFGRVGGIGGTNLRRVDDMLIKMKKYFSSDTESRTNTTSLLFFLLLFISIVF